jgi:GDP-fucose protein O-fucosyltransferase
MLQVTISHAMGRILVMPPEQGMYLLGKGESGQKNRFTFTDFFHFDSMALEHAGVEIISYEEFLNREVMAGQMKNKRGQVTFPPYNRTDWNGADRNAVKELDRWTRTFATNPKWFFDDCMAAFPAGTGEGGPVRMREWLEEVKKTDFETRRKEYDGKPVPVDAPPLDRLRENFAHRKDLCIYDQTLQDAKVFHLMGDNQSGARLLVHFYAFLFFEDWKQDVWTKRFVRDHLRVSVDAMFSIGLVVAFIDLSVLSPRIVSIRSNPSDHN